MKTVIPLALLSLVTGISLGVRSHVRSEVRIRALAFPARQDFYHDKREALGFDPAPPGIPLLRVLIIVTSSWTDRSRANRATFRNSSLLLVPPRLPWDLMIMEHRFLIGRAPRSRDVEERRRWMAAEQAEHKDIREFDVDDSYEALSQKTLAAYRWADGVAFDWVIKTDDDVRAPRQDRG